MSISWETTRASVGIHLGVFPLLKKFIRQPDMTGEVAYAVDWERGSYPDSLYA